MFVAMLRLRGAPEERATLLFLPLAVGLAAFVLNNSVGISPFTGRTLALSNLLAGLTVPFMWGFCLALFDRGFRPSALILAVGMLWIVLALATRGYLGDWADNSVASGALLLLGLAIVIHLGWRLVRESNDDMLEWRRAARGWIVLFLGVLLFVDLAADILLGYEWRPLWFAAAQNFSIAAFAGWIGLRTVPSAAKATTNVAGVADPLAAAVNRLMEEDRVYLDPDLGFDRFVTLTGFPARAVRGYVNGVLGHDHFRAFLNQFRVAEACRRLSDPAHDGDKLIAVAFDSGFASLASFNRLFRAATGRTPSDFRSKRGNGERAASF